MIYTLKTTKKTQRDTTSYLKRRTESFCSPIIVKLDTRDKIVGGYIELGFSRPFHFRSDFHFFIIGSIILFI